MAWQFLYGADVVASHQQMGGEWEQYSAKRLILSGSSHIALHGQVGQELLNLLFTHLLGVPLVMEQNVAPNPVDVGLLGADAVVFEADFCANLIE